MIAKLIKILFWFLNKSLQKTAFLRITLLILEPSSVAAPKPRPSCHDAVISLCVLCNYILYNASLLYGTSVAVSTNLMAFKETVDFEKSEI